MMKELYDISVLFLRFLREFEKRSWILILRKNEEKWRKMREKSCLGIPNHILLLWENDKLLVTSLKPFPNNPRFLRVCIRSLLKTVWEKDKITHNEQFLLFPQRSVFAHLENLLPFSSNLKLSSEKSFSLELSKMCRLGKG